MDMVIINQHDDVNTCCMKETEKSIKIREYKTKQSATYKILLKTSINPHTRMGLAIYDVSYTRVIYVGRL